MLSKPAYIAFGLILAALLDFMLMLWLRHIQRQAPLGEEQDAVRLFGRPSLALTWLRNKLIQVKEYRSEPADAAAEPAPRRGWARLRPRGVWWEWALLWLAVTLFCIGFLDLKSPTRLPGNESEVFQMLDWTLVNSLRLYHRFPLWNPYIMTGVPFVADPMLHAYNPVVTLPVLLFGVRTGFKLGVYFSFLLAAFGMWRLAKTLGMGTAGRLWVALMYTFAGQPAARFFQGQYLFVLGFAWIPWIISSLLRLRQNPTRREVALGAIALALLFFSGNAYYPVYMLIAIGLLMLVMLLRIQRQPLRIHVDGQPFKAYLATGILALGMIAIQLFPTVEIWPRLNKDLNLAGSQSLGQIFLDYTSTDSYREDAYSVLPAREEFYAYIGLTPFLALSLLPLALWKRPSREMLFFALLVMLAAGWVSLEQMPWRELFLKTRALIEFRHLLRILIFGSLGLIVLAGMGLDALWKLFGEMAGADNDRGGLGRRLRTAGLVVLGGFMLYGVADLFNANQPILRSQADYLPAYTVMRWVRQNDLSAYYVRHTPTNAWHEATISNDLRFLEVWYHFADIRSLDGKTNQRWVQAEPNYLTQTPSEPAPEDAKLVATIEEYNIFQYPEHLPMAFLVEDAVLADYGDGQWLRRSDVTPLLPVFNGPNGAEIIAEAAPGQTLVLLVTQYPGWQVRVDGDPASFENINGYLATQAQPGVHKYEFNFRPRSFYIGLLISLVSTGGMLYLLLGDLRFSRAILQARADSTRAAWGTAGKRLGAWWGGLQPVRTEAVYQEGILRPQSGLNLPEDSRVLVTVEPQAALAPARAASRAWLRASGELVTVTWRALKLEGVLFGAALALYLITRLIGLVDWPVYFFTDEAVQTVMAEDFVHSGLRNSQGEFLPTYFNKDPTYNLSSLSVYLQVLPYLIFGKSVFVTRAVSVIIGWLGALAVGLTLRDIFKLRYWWAGVLLLSITPAWFLQSRTAFETVEMSAFYAGFLYFYLRYRYISPKNLYAALVLGAMVFYTYSPGQLIIVVSGLFFLISDMRYHLSLLRDARTRPVLLRAVVLLGVLVLPYLRYYLDHPTASLAHLSTRAPYWFEDVPFSEKLAKYFKEYLYGLSPGYWFIPNQHDLDRHLMKGYGNMFLSTLPLIGVGIAWALRRFRDPAHRDTLLALLAAPSGSALVGIGVTRVLVLIIPAVLLMTVGLCKLLEWLEKLLAWVWHDLIKARAGADPATADGETSPQPTRLQPAFALILAAVLMWTNIAMTRDALTNGPLWYQDYTLGGMQYGASQLFTAVNEYVRQNPTARLMVTPNWTNGADAVAQFFLTPGAPVQLGSIEGHMFRHLPLPDNLVFVVMPQELDKVLASGKFQDVSVEQSIPYPNGEPGFFFIHVRYVDNIDDLLVVEQQGRRALLEKVITFQGQDVKVSYSMLDMGSINLLFDGNPSTVARTLEANPFVIELEFPEPRQVSGYSMVVGASQVQVTAMLFPAADAPPVTYMDSFAGTVNDPQMEVTFNQTYTVQKIHFEVLQPYTSEPANVHVWEITLK